MRLNELAVEIQQELEEGMYNFIIYQQGRQWKYEKYSTKTEEEKEAGKMTFLRVKRMLDDTAIVINGKKDFCDYDIKYIEKTIKNLKEK